MKAGVSWRPTARRRRRRRLWSHLLQWTIASRERDARVSARPIRTPGARLEGPAGIRRCGTMGLVQSQERRGGEEEEREREEGEKGRKESKKMK